MTQVLSNLMNPDIEYNICKILHSNYTHDINKEIRRKVLKFENKIIVLRHMSKLLEFNQEHSFVNYIDNEYKEFCKKHNVSNMNNVFVYNDFLNFQFVMYQWNFYNKFSYINRVLSEPEVLFPDEIELLTILKNKMIKFKNENGLTNNTLIFYDDKDANRWFNQLINGISYESV